MADAATSLKPLRLAANRFDNISPAEEKLLDAAANGKDADCTNLPEENRTIRAEVLSWLCTDREASAQVTHRGLFNNRSGD